MRRDIVDTIESSLAVPKKEINQHQGFVPGVQNRQVGGYQVAPVLCTLTGGYLGSTRTRMIIFRVSSRYGSST